MASDQFELKALMDWIGALEDNEDTFSLGYPSWWLEMDRFTDRKLRNHAYYSEIKKRLSAMNTASSFLADQDNATGLATILYAIVSDNDFFTEQSPSHPSSPPRRDPVANNIQKIFIVHGHDEEARKDADLFLRKQGLNPVILMEQPSGGKTIIEKLEEYTDVVGFGIVLYTPCDKTAEGRSRARQNVVLEHGYLMGKLGRGRVCALVKGDVELPSDNSGIVYIAMGTGNDWKVELVRELKKTGYDASADKI